jgi:hypothetical protein
MTRVYLSSTFEDLKDYRAAVVQAIRWLGQDVIAMEDYVASDERPLELVLRDVAAADIYVGIFAHRYGYIPPSPDNPDRLSVTELEYRQALRQGKRCYLFLLDDHAPWSPQFLEAGEGREKLVALRREIMERTPVSFFSTPADLASQVVTVLARDFDAFLSYSSRDKEAVAGLAARLKRDGLRIWIDDDELHPGDDWAGEARSALARVPAVAVFVGPHGIGHHQEAELVEALDSSRPGDGRFRLIPVLLPGADAMSLPPYLAKYLWVDFRDSLDNGEAYRQLKDALLPRGAPVSPPDGRDIAEQDLRMLPELLFRLAARLRERPEMLQSLDATAFWAAVRKVQPSASTIDDLPSVNNQLRGELAPGALWTAWMLNTRATELKALLLQHPGATAPA